MYLFIAIIFIAELIIAVTIINYIVKADRTVLKLNQCVTAFNPLAKTCMQYSRCLVSAFSKSFSGFVAYVEKKREQIIFKTILIVAIYSLLFIFKIKSDKVSKFYRLAGAIRDIAADFVV